MTSESTCSSSGERSHHLEFRVRLVNFSDVSCISNSPLDRLQVLAPAGNPELADILAVDSPLVAEEDTVEDRCNLCQERIRPRTGLGLDSLAAQGLQHNALVALHMAVDAEAAAAANIVDTLGCHLRNTLQQSPHHVEDRIGDYVAHTAEAVRRSSERSPDCSLARRTRPVLGRRKEVGHPDCRGRIRPGGDS